MTFAEVLAAVGLAADRPSATGRKARRIFVAEDTNEAWITDGEEWVALGGGGAPVVTRPSLLARQSIAQTIDAEDPPIFVPVTFDDVLVGADDYVVSGNGFVVPADGALTVAAAVTMLTPSPGNTYSIRLMNNGGELFKHTFQDNNNQQIPNGTDLTSTIILPPTTELYFYQGDVISVEVSFNEAAPLDTVPGMQTQIAITPFEGYDTP